MDALMSGWMGKRDDERANRTQGGRRICGLVDRWLDECMSMG